MRERREGLIWYMQGKGAGGTLCGGRKGEEGEEGGGGRGKESKEEVVIK